MSEPISVVHFVRRIRAEDGGVVQTVLDLCQTVAARGHRVILTTLDATDVPGHWAQGKDKVPQVIELETATWLGRLSKAALRRFKEIIADVQLAHLHTPWEICNIQLASSLRAARVPYIVTVHGMLDDWCMRQKSFKKRAFLRLFARRLFQHAATVHFTAEAERDQALQWIPGTFRSAVQACAIDLAPYESLPGLQPALAAFPQIQPEAKKILFLSRLHPKKGIELLLEAGAILRDRGQPVQLLIAGPGESDYLQQLETLNEKLGLNGQSQFLGMVRGVEKLSLYQLADVFVLPTYQENFGLVLPEAMATGTPVITTRGTDIWRELEQAGATIVSNSPTSIADAIEDLLSDEPLRKRVGQQGREYVRRWLNRDRVSEGYEKMYRDTIERGASPR